MWGPAGRAYVYFVYGMHFCANVVAAGPGEPEAVLLRAAEPIAGLEFMRSRRTGAGGPPADAALARGPGNLARAFAIDRSLDGTDLRAGGLRILVPRELPLPPRRDVVRSPRIGVDDAGRWASRLLRFSLRGSPAVSRPPASRRPRRR